MLKTLDATLVLHLLFCMILQNVGKNGNPCGGSRLSSTVYLLRGEGGGGTHTYSGSLSYSTQNKYIPWNIDI